MAREQDGSSSEPAVVGGADSSGAQLVRLMTDMAELKGRQERLEVQAQRRHEELLAAIQQLVGSNKNHHDERRA